MTPSQSTPTTRLRSPSTFPDYVKTRAKETYRSVEVVEVVEVLEAPSASVVPSKHKALGSLLARLVRCLGAFLLALRRARSVVRIRKFLLVRDATSRRRELSRKIKRVIDRIVRIQRVWRSAVVCKRAKMQVVMDMWDEEERVVVRTLTLAGHRARRSIQGRGQGYGQAMKLVETRRTAMERDETTGAWCTVDLHRRWDMVQERFRAFDMQQKCIARSMMLPKRVKTQFARRYVEAARKAHLTLVMDRVKEEVSRLRLRVLYTADDAKHLLEADEGADSSVDRLRMRLLMQNMTSSAALATYRRLKDRHLRDDDAPMDGDMALLLTTFRERLPTFDFFQRLRTQEQQGYIQTAVKAAHNCDRRTI